MLRFQKLPIIIIIYYIGVNYRGVGYNHPIIKNAQYNPMDPQCSTQSYTVDYHYYIFALLQGMTSIKELVITGVWIFSDFQLRKHRYVSYARRTHIVLNDIQRGSVCGAGLEGDLDH